MILPCSKYKITYKIILVTAIDIQNNPWRHTFFRFFKVENCSEKQVLPKHT